MRETEKLFTVVLPDWKSVEVSFSEVTLEDLNKILDVLLDR